MVAFSAIQLPNGLTALLISDMMLLDGCSESSATNSESGTTGTTGKGDDASMTSDSDSENDMQTDDEEDDTSDDDIADRVYDAGSKGKRSKDKEDKRKKHGERMVSVLKVQNNHDISRR